MSGLPQSAVLARPGPPPGPGAPPDGEPAVALLGAIVDLMTRLLQIAEANAVRGSPRDRYTTGEVAKLLGKRPRTPQKWCRDRQVHCIRVTRDGTYRLTREEVERVRNRGLLPPGAGEVTEE